MISGSIRSNESYHLPIVSKNVHFIELSKEFPASEEHLFVLVLSSYDFWKVGSYLPRARFNIKRHVSSETIEEMEWMASSWPCLKFLSQAPQIKYQL